MDHAGRFEEYKCCVIIPTYNNERTIGKVISEVLLFTSHVIVVNDGATDSTPDILQSFGDEIQVITFSKNRGKGAALRQAFQVAREAGHEYAVTIDSDGQHFPSDLPLFLDQIRDHAGALVIGARNMAQAGIPGKSSFGHKFSNFWCWVETGIRLDDTQSGYRLYPIGRMKFLRSFTNRFEYEVEIVVKAAWSGIPLKNVPIQIYYEQGKDRVTHFRPFHDFTRISFLNTYLVTLALIYYIPLRFLRSLSRENVRGFLQRHFFNKTESPGKKALSVGFGVFMGIFPVWGFQLVIGLTLAHFFRLNKALFLVAANITLPPLIPVFIYLSYQVGRVVLPEGRNDLLFTNGISLEMIQANFFQYAFGAVLLAIFCGTIAGILTYVGVLVYRYQTRNAV